MSKKKTSSENGETAKLTDEQRAAIRRERFTRLAEPRVNKAIKSIKGVAQMGSRANYAYTDEEARAILAALAAAYGRVEEAFTARQKAEIGFRLA